MEYKLIDVLDNDENSIVELVENEKGQRFVRRIMRGKIEVYLALRQLSHKFLPQILSADFDGSHTVVIEEYINSRGDLSCLKSENEIVNAFCELCEVLDYIHAREIIHRDIKPSNVLVAQDGHIRLIDFDAARRYKEESSNDTRYLGTKGYAVPEQFGFTQTDYTADIYALGVTMKTVMGSIADSRKYRGIIRKCTEFDPKSRYKSASAVKTSLVFGKKRYFTEAAALVLICAVITLGASLLLNSQSSNSELLLTDVNVLESSSETIELSTAETATETTADLMSSAVTTVPVAETESVTVISESNSESAAETPVLQTEDTIVTEISSETISASITSPATTVPVAEEEFVTEISFSISEASKVSDEDFKLISPLNSKAIPKIAKKEIQDGFYTDYFIDGYNFVIDEALVGKWMSIAKIDTFDPKLIKKYFMKGDSDHIKDIETGHISSIEFSRDSNCFSFYNTYASISEWTYGAVVNDFFIDAKSISGYYIYRYEGRDYLFLEGKMNDGYLKDNRTGTDCFVFERFVKEEQITNKIVITEPPERKLISPTDEEKIAEFETRLADDGNYYDFYTEEYKFVSDPNIIGKWEAVDYIFDHTDWVYNKKNNTDNLFQKRIDVRSEGTYICYSQNTPGGFAWRWTYGQVVGNEGNYYFVNRYYLYDIGGEDFLFVEFKNGNYMRNKDWEPGLYVFKRCS